MLKKSLDSSASADWEKAKNLIAYPSSMNFLMAHLGIRKEMLHGLIGTMGSGKSSLMKRIIADTATRAKTHVWISEETMKEYQPGVEAYWKWPQVYRKNMTWTEENEISEDILVNRKRFTEYFCDIVTDSGAEVVFIDNVTTSYFYSEEIGISGQAANARFLQKAPKLLKCSIFYCAHTGKHVQDNQNSLFKPEDIRGPNTLPIRTEYLYTFHKFTAEDDQYSIVKNCKYRHHTDAGGYYMLYFDNGKYLKDEQIPFEVVKQTFQKRDRLTGR